MANERDERGGDAAGGGGDAPPLDTGELTDADRRRVLRTVAEEVRDESTESKQVAAFLYRVSDLYDPEEDTSPEEIYRNVRIIMDVKARGGLRPDDYEDWDDAES
ncbi:MAG: hypothetical protein ABEJ22_03300 [Haloferacaceae archaeon]